MNFKNPLLRIPLRYGLVGGTLGCIVIAALYYMGRHPFLLPVIFDFRIVIFAVFIFFSLRELRDNHLEGTLYFWQGMLGSYVFVLTSALMGALFSWCFAAWNRKFLPSYVEKLQQQMVDFKGQIITSVGTDAYNQQFAKLPLTTPLDMAGDYFLKSLIIGLFLAIIMSAILRKQPKTQ